MVGKEKYLSNIGETLKKLERVIQRYPKFSDFVCCSIEKIVDDYGDEGGEPLFNFLSEKKWW